MKKTVQRLLKMTRAIYVQNNNWLEIDRCSENWRVNKSRLTIASMPYFCACVCVFVD